MSVLIKTVAVTFENGQTEDMPVHEIKLREYPVALKQVDDEFALVGLACRRAKTVIQDLTPASYEAVMAAVWQVNEHGFFSYARRQEKLGAERLSRMGPQAVEALGEAILKQQSSGSAPKPA